MAEAAAAAKGDTGTGEQKPAAQQPAGEQKPGEQKPAEAAQKPGEQAAEKPASKDDQGKPESKAPEKYALTLPDSGHLDATDLETIEAIAREQGWTNDEAQQRVILHAEAVAAQSARFLEDTKSDPVYGGPRLDETTKLATAALDKLRPKGTPRGDALRALLNKSGYGNHLEVVSLLADLGKVMAEDGTVGASGGAPAKDVATILYGDAPVK